MIFPKLHQMGEIIFPWRELIGLFLTLAGFVVGLGSVTVIDWHGFLGRKSKYWTEATTRTHKITKPLIWTGLVLIVFGSVIYYPLFKMNDVTLVQFILIGILILNGLFLTFHVSPYLILREKEGRAKELLPQRWQRKIMISFIISFLAWWSALFLMVWHLVTYK